MGGLGEDAFSLSSLSSSSPSSSSSPLRAVIPYVSSSRRSPAIRPIPSGRRRRRRGILSRSPLAASPSRSRSQAERRSAVGGSSPVHERREGERTTYVAYAGEDYLLSDVGRVSDRVAVVPTDGGEPVDRPSQHRRYPSARDRRRNTKRRKVLHAGRRTSPRPASEQREGKEHASGTRRWWWRRWWGRTR